MAIGRPKSIRPIDEGSMRKIYDLFIVPLLSNNLFQDGNRFLESIFRVDQRTINHWVATEDFFMPGLYRAAPMVKIQGTGYNKIKAGSGLLSRKDEDDPTIDVEFMAGPGQQDQVFCLETLEWEWVLRYLRPTTPDDLFQFKDYVRRGKASRVKAKRDSFK